MQAFEGTVIARNNTGMGETITVRKVSFGQGVERIFPLHAPVVDHIDVVRTGRVRRAKLYYLRDLKGKAARLRERDISFVSADPFACPPAATSEPLRRAGFRAIAGLDEAGRGALFGPVFAAAVVLDPDRPIRGLDDSKALEPERREVLAARIRERAVAWAVGAADAFEIDRINILQARALAMKRALEQLNAPCDYLLIDALKLDVEVAQKPLIHGDALCFSIAAASILAKTAPRCRAGRMGSRFPRIRIGAATKATRRPITSPRSNGSGPPRCIASASSRCARRPAA